MYTRKRRIGVADVIWNSMARSWERDHMYERFMVMIVGVVMDIVIDMIMDVARDMTLPDLTCHYRLLIL
jgi:hypothetical protein